jgi:hypothetical protein
MCHDYCGHRSSLSSHLHRRQLAGAECDSRHREPRIRDTSVCERWR